MHIGSVVFKEVVGNVVAGKVTEISEDGLKFETPNNYIIEGKKGEIHKLSNFTNLKEAFGDAFVEKVKFERGQFVVVRETGEIVQVLENNNIENNNVIVTIRYKDTSQRSVAQSLLFSLNEFLESTYSSDEENEENELEDDEEEATL